MRVRSLLGLWFGFDAPVSRGAYLASGLGLMGVKYLVEALVIQAVTGRAWTPADYLIPSFDRYKSLHAQPLAVALAIWTLPFMWIGASMTVRRAANAGLSAAWGLLFFVPLLNHLVMLVLAGLPARGTAAHTAQPVSMAPGSAVRSAFVGVLVGVLIVLVVVGFSTLALGSYGVVLFIGTPFVMGYASSSIFNGSVRRTGRATAGLALITVIAASGVALSLAMEGAVCLLMAFPLAAVLAIAGALLAWHVAINAGRPYPVAPTLLLVAALPALLGMTASAPTAAGSASAVREVVSAIEIDTPPEVVWTHVIGFGDLPPPVEWEFRAGVAYPLRARIDGQGVGAVRRCEFSTGAFVEPITVWDPPRRLSFDVREQPPGLRELSPYDDVHAPHVNGYMKSRRGEFRLRPLPGGRTRLEGSTFYTLDVFPSWYWTRFSDAIVGRIHQRVLRHIKNLAETAARARP